MPVNWSPLDPATGLPTSGSGVLDFSRLPSLPTVADRSRNPIVSGLKAGTQEALGLTATAAEAVGSALKIDSLRDWAAEAAASRFQRAQEVGRPDLDVAPWREGGASAAPWLGYQTARMLPSIAAMLAGSAVVPEAAVPAGLKTLGARVPATLGGGARAATAAERAATGAEWARAVTGATIAGYPLGVGSLYDSAKDAGIEGQGTALSALAAGLPYAALEALEPAQLKRFAAPAVKDGIAKGIGRAVAATAIAQVPQEAAQTAMEMAYRPDLPLSEKLANMVDAGVTAGIVGGVLGAGFRGAGYLRGMRRAKPTDVSTEDMENTADAVLGTGDQTFPDKPTDGSPIDPSAAVGAGTSGGLDVKTYVDDYIAGKGREDPTYQQFAADNAQEIEQEFQRRQAETPPAWTAQGALNTALGERAAAAKINPVLDQLRTAADETDQIRTVRDMLEARGEKAPATLRRLGQFYGLQNPDGTPRDLQSEINDIDARLQLERRGATPDEQVVTDLQTQRAELVQKKNALDAVDERINDRRQTVWQFAERIIGRKGNPAIRKSGAENLDQLVEWVMKRIEDDKITPSITKLADFFNLRATPEESGYQKDLAEAKSRLALLQREGQTNPEAAAQAEQLQQSISMMGAIQRAVDGAFARRAEPAETTTQTAEETPPPAPRPPTTPQEVVTQALGTTSRSNPVVRDLEGVRDQADLVGRVMDYVSDRTGKKMSPSWQRVAEAVGLVDVAGRPRDLAGEIETINQQLRVIDPEATDQIVELEDRREALQQQARVIETAQQGRAPWLGWNVPAPAVAAPIDGSAVVFEALRARQTTPAEPPLLLDTPEVPLSELVAQQAQRTNPSEVTNLALAPAEQQTVQSPEVPPPAPVAPPSTGSELPPTPATGALPERQSFAPRPLPQRGLAASTPTTLQEVMTPAEEKPSKRRPRPEQPKRRSFSPEPQRQRTLAAPSEPTTRTNVEETVVHDQLTPTEQSTLAKHYGEKEYNDVAKRRFVNDLVTAINNGLTSVAVAIRRIVKRIMGAVLATSLVFNVSLTQPPVTDVTTDFSTTRTVPITQMVPENARAMMSDRAIAVYETMAPAAIGSGKGFMIADKPSGAIHVFDRTGALIDSGPALFGMSAGDQFIEAPDKTDMEAMSVSERITPAGTYRLQQRSVPSYPGGQVLAFQKDGQDVGANSSGYVAVHSVWLEKPEQRREERLASTTPDDNKISFGCINTSSQMFLGKILPHVAEFDGGTVFVLPDAVETTAAMFPAQTRQETVAGTRTEQVPSGVPAPDERLPGLPAGQTARDRVSRQTNRRPTDRADQPPQQTAQEKVADTLTDADREVAKKHFGHEQFDERTERALLASVLQAIREGITSVPARIRAIVKKLMAEIKAFMADTSGMLGGRKALSANLTALDEAQLRIERGDRPDEVLKDTGWYKGEDDRWKFEIDDTAAKLRPFKPDPTSPVGVVLSDVLFHPWLFKAYPNLRSMPVEFDAVGDFGGSFDPAGNFIQLTAPSGSTSPATLSSLLHEIQHAVQEVEDFARGGNPGSVDAYDDRNINRTMSRINTELEGYVSDPDVAEVMAFTGKDVRVIDQTDLRRTANAERWSEDRLVEAVNLFTSLRKWQRYALSVQELSDAAPTIRQLEADLSAKPDRMFAERLRSLRGAVSGGAAIVQNTIYRNLAGEIEARNVQIRQGYSADRRRNIPPSTTETLVRDPGIAPVVSFETAPARSTGPIADNARAQQAVQQVESWWENVKDLQTVGAGARKLSMGWRSLTDLFAQYGKLFTTKDGNPFERYMQARQSRDAIKNQIVQMQRAAMDGFYDLRRVDPKAADTVQTLMKYTAEDIDPRRSWDDHTWLHDDEDAAYLRGRVDKANGEYRALVSKRQHKVYDDLLASNNADWFSRFAVQMQNFMQATFPGQQVAGFDAHPMDGYMAASDLHTDPVGAARYWRQQVDQRIAGAEAFVQAVEADGRPRAVKALKGMLTSIRKYVADVEQAPYFHLGRGGDYFVSMTMKTGEGGRIDRNIVRRIAKHLDAAGFGHVSLNSGTGVSDIYLRVENPEQQQALFDVAKKMRAAGLLVADKPIVQGPRSDDDVRRTISPEWLQNVIDAVVDSDTFEATAGMTEDQTDALARSKADLRVSLTQAWLDLLPDNSINRVMARRRVVPGYSGDMIRNFAFRSDVSANALASLTAAPRSLGALREMQSAIRAARRDESMTLQNRQRMFDVYGELTLREARAPLRAEHGFVDTLTAANHAYFLSMSPAYMLTQLTAVPVLLWPELAKTHGFVNAAKAIAKVTPMAFNILRAVAAEGWRHGNLRFADASVTMKALKAAGIPSSTAKFVMGMVNRGHIDIGGLARETSRLASKAGGETAWDKTLRFASATSVYPELMTRLIAGLSARELHGGKPDLERYADTVVDQSMFSWGTWNTARQIGKAGAFGNWSRILFAFHNYTYQLIEKMYREMTTAFTRPGTTKEERAAARRWMGGHLAAVGFLAGTAGMPIASVIFAAIDALANQLGDDKDKPYDVQTAWRNFLSDSLGKGVGEVIARGAPRAIGADFSGRVGEQNILPFSKLLTDKANWRDSINNYLASAAGAPVSMLGNLIEGTSTALDGDVLTGMKQTLPVALKGPIEAMRMTTDGYVDRAGNKMPMSAGANDVMMQFLGITPAEKAEYTEESQAAKNRLKGISREASALRRRLAVAIESGDRESAVELLREARRFDQAHPTHAILGSLSNTIRQRARARAVSDIYGTPLGVRVNDPDVRSAIGFGNYGSGQ